MLSQQDAIVQATAYINQLKGSIEELKMRKELTMRSNGSSKSGSEHPPELDLAGHRTGVLGFRSQGHDDQRDRQELHVV
ncbi:hypothetical protein NL676_028842 [Syzygium grande]|nr:hypothetical protein NL676_028842 [Syzygium grande]